ncbi:MAG: AAA family ATPase [Acidimicrobiales bacterium]
MSAVEREGRPAPAAVAETHSAVLFFVGDRAYKMKKPVDLGFLDFTDRAARQRACLDEVALNSRLAPTSYLGVADVIGPDALPCEHLVIMRRMPEERRLSACVARGEDVDDALRSIARSLAALHDASPPDAVHDRLGTAASVRARWEAGFEQLADVRELDGSDEAAIERDQRIAELVRRYLVGRADLFEHRIRRGRIRDGHGDLQADDIFLVDEGPQILDCLEFAEDLRWGDVLSDVAFLAMDLERLGHPELGAQLLRCHAEYAGDTWPASLGHHYVAYRAHVRAKVGVLRARQDRRAPDAGTDALFDLALRHLEQGRVRLVVVGGPPGTGKSTVAAGLAERLDAVVLRTDEARTAPMDERYAPAEVRATYERVLTDAERLLRRGEHVVIDATFGDPAVRALVRQVAEGTASDLTELRCAAPVEVAAARVAQRVAVGGDPSEATPEIARRLADGFAPWPESVVLRTEAPAAEVVDAAVAAVG